MAVVLRPGDAVCALGDERMTVAQLSTRGIELIARPAADPHDGNARVLQRGHELVESGMRFASDRQQGIDGAVDDGSGLKQGQAPRKASLYRASADRRSDVQRGNPRRVKSADP